MDISDTSDDLWVMQLMQLMHGTDFAVYKPDPFHASMLMHVHNEGLPLSPGLVAVKKIECATIRA